MLVPASFRSVFSILAYLLTQISYLDTWGNRFYKKVQIIATFQVFRSRDFTSKVMV
jgi:hypothetical protein